MSRPKTNSKRTYVFLSDADFVVLERQAIKEGSTVSAILRRLAKNYIVTISEKDVKHLS